MSTSVPLEDDRWGPHANTGALVIRQDPHQLREHAARRLLRRLRDLNLGDGSVPLKDGNKVRITGCASLDHPVEGGVRYRLNFSDGGAEIVEIQWHGGRLHSHLTKNKAQAHDSGTSFGLNGHPSGLVELSGLQSAIDLSSASSEDYEVLLSLIVEATVEAA